MGTKISTLILTSLLLTVSASSTYHYGPAFQDSRKTHSIMPSTLGNTSVFTKKRTALHSSIYSTPRGGDLAGIAAIDLAKLFSGLVSIDGISGTLFPSASCELAGVKVPPKSLRRLSIEAMGSAAGSLSISSFLAITEKVSIEKAVAYGLISRLFFLVRGFLSYPADMEQYINFKIKALVCGILIFAVLSGLSPSPLTVPLQVFNLYLLFQSTRSYLLESLSKYFKPSKTEINPRPIIDVTSEGELTAQLWQFAHGYNVISCFFQLLILFGVAPVKAVGFTSILLLAWFLDVTLIKKAQNMISIKWLKWVTPVVFPIFGAIAVGTLKK
mmetsp:Transcript_26488/g.37974  ORF Transcript_26488/g.37974 Transcript_26488/m.37974 type:complete len:328 (+) Transcript_26488:150-1133(+)